MNEYAEDDWLPMRHLLVPVLLFTAVTVHAADGVVLLHGIGLNPSSLSKMEAALKDAGYQTLNLDYPDRKQDLAGIVTEINPAITSFAASVSGSVSFVTHSMGGLVARGYIATHRPSNLGRVVMLSPPNSGSEVADFLKSNPVYEAFYGPAGQQLTTYQDPSLSALLGKVDYPLGIIAGDRSIDPVSSFLLIPGPDDGKVAVSRTMVEGMADFTVIHATHTFMMDNPQVISNTLLFLRESRFQHSFTNTKRW